MHKKISLQTDFQKFVDHEYTHSINHCLGGCKKEQPIYSDYGGLPKTYVHANTIIFQEFWDTTQCDFEDFGKQLNMEVVTVSSIMQPPGCVIPLHNDTFFQIKKRYPDRKETMVRANIFCENWKHGHFLQYNSTVDSNWKQGQGHMWDSEVLHIGANVGMENKYTLQVSGFLNGS